MKLEQLNIPPGIYRNGTDYQSKGRWYDANLVRWENGAMLPVGGWQVWTGSTLTGKARGMHAWVDNSGDRRIAVGTQSKLYAINEAATISDITPVGITTGSESSAAQDGYGKQTFGTGTYGTPRSSLTSISPAATWSLDNWGQNLVGCLTSDGKLYEYTLSGVAAAISGAPTSCRGLVVTEERFLFALGAGGNKRKVQWCDQEDNTTWTPASTNQAGSKELATSGQIMCGKRVRGQTLILTDVDAHTATYQGPPYVYGFTRVGDGCGVAGPNAAVVLPNGTAMWMGKGGNFYTYDGSAVRPVASDVADFLARDVNWDQAEKIYGFTNGEHNEVWWLYQSATGSDSDSYVAYNAKEGHWSIGSISRSAGVDAGVHPKPMMVGTDGYVYEHETDYAYGGASIYAESGPIEIGNGDNLMWCTMLVPDELTLGDVSATFKVRDWPTDSETSYGPYTLATPTPIRFTGRATRVRVDGVRPASWRVGIMRLEVQEAGKR